MITQPSRTASKRLTWPNASSDLIVQSTVGLHMFCVSWQAGIGTFLSLDNAATWQWGSGWPIRTNTITSMITNIYWASLMRQVPCAIHFSSFSPENNPVKVTRGHSYRVASERLFLSQRFTPFPVVGDTPPPATAWEESASLPTDIRLGHVICSGQWQVIRHEVHKSKQKF